MFLCINQTAEHRRVTDGSGVIAKYTTSGGYCVLATGVATPQAVEIHDGENKVWFTDSNINLFEVSMGPTGGCPASPPSCSAVPDCNGVAVGMDAVGSGAHTEGGLIKAGDNFYMSEYVSLCTLATSAWLVI